MIDPASDMESFRVFLTPFLFLVLSDKYVGKPGTRFTQRAFFFFRKGTRSSRRKPEPAGCARYALAKMGLQQACRFQSEAVSGAGPSLLSASGLLTRYNPSLRPHAHAMTPGHQCTRRQRRLGKFEVELDCFKAAKQPWRPSSYLIVSESSLTGGEGNAEMVLYGGVGFVRFARLPELKQSRRTAKL